MKTSYISIKESKFILKAFTVMLLSTLILAASPLVSAQVTDTVTPSVITTPTATTSTSANPSGQLAMTYDDLRTRTEMSNNPQFWNPLNWFGIPSTSTSTSTSVEPIPSNIPEPKVKPEVKASPIITQTKSTKTSAKPVAKIEDVLNSISPAVAGAKADSTTFALPSILTQAGNSFNYSQNKFSPETTRSLYSIAGLLIVMGAAMTTGLPALAFKRREAGDSFGI